MSFIIKTNGSLFLGSKEDAKNEKFANDNKISVIINVTRDVKDHYKYGTMMYYRVPIDDDLTDISTAYMAYHLRYMPEIIQFHLSKGDNLLVHCFAGKERSATVVLAYLIKYHFHSYKLALKYLLDKKKDVFYHGKNENFKDLFK